MRTFKFIAAYLVIGFILGAGQSFSQTSLDSSLSLGSIDFPTSASEEVQKEFLTGVLALHSFWYPEARDHFQRAREMNPTFAMAYWGEAMTYDHPIWEQHDLESGAEIFNQLDQQIENDEISWSEREKEYIDALRILYNDEFTLDERREKYAEAMRQLTNQYSDDDEARAFAALAGMTVPDYNYSDPDVRDLIPIASNLEELYQRNPDHPGAMHYLIHIYDNKKFAEMGLRPARDYADVAYSSSHAIHMPSHIYKHMEMWDKVIESNIRAYEASVEWQQETDRPLKNRDYHSYRWLFEAYLEVDNFEKACEIIQEMDQIKEQARERGEDLGRIPNLIDNFSDQYQNTEGNAPECKN